MVLLKELRVQHATEKLNKNASPSRQIWRQRDVQGIPETKKKARRLENTTLAPYLHLFLKGLTRSVNSPCINGTERNFLLASLSDIFQQHYTR